MLGRIWFIGFGSVLVVLPFTEAPQIRWTRAGGPFHPMNAWERVLTVAIGIASIALGAIAPLD